MSQFIERLKKKSGKLRLPESRALLVESSGFICDICNLVHKYLSKCRLSESNKVYDYFSYI